MNAAPWPCSTCGAPGVKNLGTKGYCAAHLTDLYRMFDVEVWNGRGIGLQAGPRRPDHGPEFAELECAVCSATWVGTLFEPCGWCEHTIDAMRAGQVRLLLNPELPDVDDVRHDGAIRGWGERLARGVEAGLITDAAAMQAWRKVVDDDRAA